MIAYENCYKNWLVWGFWMDQLLHVNIFKTQATLIVNGENKKVFESSTQNGLSVISILVKSVIDQMISSNFISDSGGFESKLQFVDSDMNYFFRPGNNDHENYFQSEVISIFLQKKKHSEYSIKLSSGNVEYTVKNNFRSFSKNFELSDSKKIMIINMYLEIIRNIEPFNAQVIVCRAKMVKKYSSSSVCTIS